MCKNQVNYLKTIKKLNNIGFFTILIQQEIIFKYKIFLEITP
jgi:hypothetical protein